MAPCIHIADLDGRGGSSRWVEQGHARGELHPRNAWDLHHKVVHRAVSILPQSGNSMVHVVSPYLLWVELQ